MTRAVLVLGAGDMGSAVAHSLAEAGFSVAIADDPEPAHPRRGMAFADALWDGQMHLAGLDSLRVTTAEELASHIARHASVVITALPLQDVLSTAACCALVDARMRKRAVAPDRRGMVPVLIGLGPGFAAGGNCDLAIETSWEALGQVVHTGTTLPLRGEPRAIEGVGRARTVYAPIEGVVRTDLRIGDRVAIGVPVVELDGLVLRAPLAGSLRGLVRNGVQVTVGAKWLEVDPRGNPQLCFGLAERPRPVAHGVLDAISSGENIIP